MTLNDDWNLTARATDWRPRPENWELEEDYVCVYAHLLSLLLLQSCLFNLKYEAQTGLEQVEQKPKSQKSYAQKLSDGSCQTWKNNDHLTKS